MKKLILLLILVATSCTEPVVHKSQFQVMDTTGVSKNGLGMKFGYEVIVKYDSSYYPGFINRKGELIELDLLHKLHAKY